jgi:hypothetical protein
MAGTGEKNNSEDNLDEDFRQVITLKAGNTNNQKKILWT